MRGAAPLQREGVVEGFEPVLFVFLENENSMNINIFRQVQGEYNLERYIGNLTLKGEKANSLSSDSPSGSLTGMSGHLSWKVAMARLDISPTTAL